MSMPASSQIYAESPDHIPKKQQWALINQHKAMQFERLKQLERQNNLQKKMQLKKDLDYQLHNRSDAHLQEKRADRRYYEFITKKSQEMRQKQQKQKIDRFLKRKNIQSENQYYLDKMRGSRDRNQDTGYHLDIGLRSEMQRKDREEKGKKEMLDTLDKQMQIKEQQKKYLKMHELHVDNENMQYQFDQFDRRNKNHKQFGQNPRVYDYYRRLDQEKNMKQKQLQHLIVEEAAVKKKQQEDRKSMLKEQKKTFLTNQMKQTLDQQVQYHNYKAETEKKTNPQENSYAVIGNVFRQKPMYYDKKQYSQYLRMQAEEQNNKRRHQKYMSDQEYRINMNQLNRAVSGDYAYNKYIDRSIGVIGDNKKVNLNQMHEPVKDEDRDVVQMKLQNIRHKTKGYEVHDKSF